MVEKLIKRLRSKGNRITRTREKMLHIFCKGKPLTVAELMEEVEKSGKVNRTTIYREVWFLRDIGIIKEVNLGGGSVKFELITAECHHHLVCEGCGKIEDVRINEKALINEINSKTSFQTKSHSIEFFGLCINCQ